MATVSERHALPSPLPYGGRPAISCPGEKGVEGVKIPQPHLVATVLQERGAISSVVAGAGRRRGNVDEGQHRPIEVSLNCQIIVRFPTITLPPLGIVIKSIINYYYYIKTHQNGLELRIHERIMHCQQLVWDSKLGSSGYQIRTKREAKATAKLGLCVTRGANTLRKCMRPVLPKMNTRIFEEKVRARSCRRNQTSTCTPRHSQGNNDSTIDSAEEVFLFFPGG